MGVDVQILFMLPYLCVLLTLEGCVNKNLPANYLAGTFLVLFLGMLLQVGAELSAL
jgi:hypothetical protein